MNKAAMQKTISMFLVLVLAMVVVGGCAPAAKKPYKKTKVTKEPIITLYINETGQKKRINMEEYIKGVVAAEMDPGWPVNALAAQAILARTFTMKQIKSKGGVPQHKADASTSVEEFQAYDVSRINDNVKKAVEMTRGQVVKYKGQFINAWFSACDGGEEASAAEGLAFFKEKTPYIKAGAKDGCLKVTLPENKAWTAKFPENIVVDAVRKISGKEPGPLTQSNVKVAKRGPSGRAETILIGKANVGGAALRLALGNDKMRSIYLDSLAYQGGQVVMAGKGYGHGVGMCQWGAKKMAQEGKKPQDIIKFYFKGVTVEKVWK